MALQPKYKTRKFKINFYILDYSSWKICIEIQKFFLNFNEIMAIRNL
jgi:hypothetical protein